MNKTLVLLLLTITANIHAQRKISGRVINHEKKPIVDATISIKGSTKETTTNAYGLFEIEVSESDQFLVASHISCQMVEVKISEQDRLFFYMPKAAREIPLLDIRAYSKRTNYSIEEERKKDFEIVNNDTIYKTNASARFKSGDKELFNYIGENFSLPELAENNLAKGIVTLVFTIDQKGKPYNIRSEGDTLYGIGNYSCKLISEMPNWTPAKQLKKNVEQDIIMKIKYETIVFLVVDEPPTFPGGMTEFNNYIKQNLTYTKEAKRKQIEGKVFVEFLINKQGRVVDNSVKVIMGGLGYGLNEEAIRLMNNCPQWNPGKQMGEPQMVRLVLPITFKL